MGTLLQPTSLFPISLKIEEVYFPPDKGQLHTEIPRHMDQTILLIVLSVAFGQHVPAFNKSPEFYSGKVEFSLHWTLFHIALVSTKQNLSLLFLTSAQL